jgi:predicted enzyme related to lactoylglutathione lyase
MSTYLSGSPCWVDLGTPDPPKATLFYAALFGWEVEEPDVDGYRLCRLDGQLVAALGPGSDQGAPYWTVNISVSDLDATVASVVREGGRLIAGPGSAGDLGRFAVTLDVVGTPVSLWEPGLQTGAELVGVPQTWAQTELVTDRPDVAQPFYRSVFGWEECPTRTGSTREWELNGTSVASLRQSPGGWTSDRSSLWTVHFGVSDVKRAVEDALRLGATFVLELSPRAGAVLLADNQGALFGLCSVMAR